MKALVWNNPYGSLMLHGKQETRRRDTKVRGEVLICTAKKPYDFHQLISISGEHQYGRICDLLQLYYNHYNHGWHSTLEPTIPLYGYAIAVGELTGARPMKATDQDACYVAHHMGLWVWTFENVRRIDPFPWQFGKQGWLNVPETELLKIKYL